MKNLFKCFLAYLPKPKLFGKWQISLFCSDLVEEIINSALLRGLDRVYLKLFKGGSTPVNRSQSLMQDNKVLELPQINWYSLFRTYHDNFSLDFYALIFGERSVQILGQELKVLKLFKLKFQFSIVQYVDVHRGWQVSL
jgi:hypothetical protein